MKKTILKLLATILLLSGLPIKQAHAVDYSQVEPKPLASSINPEITSPSPSYMESAFGRPGDLTTNCSSVTNTNLQRLIVTDSVGPFRVTGLKPAIEAIKRIFAAVKLDKPELYSQLGTEGMLCVRAIRDSNPPVFSNHSWGTAIDIKINGKLDQRGDNKTQLGLKELYPYFLSEGFYWGAKFPTEDSMHFEVSKGKIAKWRAEDFNGDGKSDILWRNESTGENRIWLMNGTNLASAPAIAPVPDLNWRMAGSGDFNSDGQPDILWRNYSTGENSIWLMNGTELASAILITSTSDLNWRMAGSGDFNNDAKPDILWRNYSTGENNIWLMNGTELTSAIPITSVSDLNWWMTGSGDYNGDGKSDIIWRNESTGENSIWLMNGAGLASAILITSASDLNWKMLGTGDYNGDGRSDILWRNSTTGENSIWLMNGTNLTSTLLIDSVSDLNWQIGGPR